MEWILIVGLAWIGAILLALALAGSARSGEHRELDDYLLARLGRFRSPSGRPFFASQRERWDLMFAIRGLRRASAARRDRRKGRQGPDG